MPTRPNMRQALGREHIYGDGGGAGGANLTPAEPMPSPTPAAKWEASNQRVTFHCPNDLLAAVEASMATTGRSKSRVIVDALREHLSGTG